MSNRLLALIASEIESDAAISTDANPTVSGYWKRIALAAEEAAGVSTNANETLTGYMLRAATAFESLSGTSGAEENPNEAGYIKRIVDALETINEETYSGSLLERMRLGAVVWSGGTPTPTPTPAATTSEPSATQYGMTLTYEANKDTGSYWNGDKFIVGPVIIDDDQPASQSLASFYFEDASCSFQDTGDTVTKSSHGLVADRIVQFVTINSTTGISTGVDYYVINPTENTFQVSSTLGGAALALTTNGAGTYKAKSITSRWINGLELNPGNANNQQQGFDELGNAHGASVSTLLAYTAVRNISTGKTGAPTAEITEGTLVKVISDQSPPETGRAALSDMAAFTVVTEVPPANAFRPPVALADKTSLWTTADVDWSVLPSLPLPAGAPGGTLPDPAVVAGKVARMFQLGVTDNTGSRNLSPSNNHPEYGRDIGYVVAEALLCCCLDFTQAEKEPILYGLIQLGIDVLGRAMEGGDDLFPDIGGGNAWRKAALVLAARCLRNSANAAILAEYADYAQHASFTEDNEFFIVSQTTVDTPRHVDVQIREEYLQYMIGAPEWGDSATSQPNYPGSEWDASRYRMNVGSSMIGMILAMRLIDGAQTAWNNQKVFDYFDRFWNYEKAETFGGTEQIQTLTWYMWDEYRADDSITPPAVVGRHMLTKGGVNYVWIEYDHLMDVNSVPATGDFAVTVNGGARSVTAVAVYGYKVALTIDGAAIAYGDTGTLAYTQGADHVRNIREIDAASFSATAVTNDEPVPIGTPSAFPVVAFSAEEPDRFITVSAAISGSADHEGTLALMEYKRNGNPASAVTTFSAGQVTVQTLTTGTLRVTLRNAAGTTIAQINSSVAVTDNVAHDILIAWDMSQADSTAGVSLYIDGVDRKGSVSTFTTGETVGYANSSSWSFGGSTSTPGATNHFVGEIGAVMLKCGVRVDITSGTERAKFNAPTCQTAGEGVFGSAAEVFLCGTKSQWEDANANFGTGPNFTKITGTNLVDVSGTAWA